MLGNEETGMDKEIERICDVNVRIEGGNIDSLNVSSAGAILMYELLCKKG